LYDLWVLSDRDLVNLYLSLSEEPARSNKEHVDSPVENLDVQKDCDDVEEPKRSDEVEELERVLLCAHQDQLNRVDERPHHVVDSVVHESFLQASPLNAIRDLGLDKKENKDRRKLANEEGVVAPSNLVSLAFT